jgi:hypothetical protein
VTAPTARQVQNALRTLAAAWGDGWELGDRHPAHVEQRVDLGGTIDTFRMYAVKPSGQNVLLAQVPRTALEDGAT